MRNLRWAAIRRRTGGAFGLLLAGALAVAAGSAAQADTVTWRFAHTTPIPGTVWHKYAVDVLPERIAAATGGQVKVQVVSGVVKPADVLRGIRDGELHGGTLLFPYVAPTLPLWNVLSLPGLVNEIDRYPEVVNRFVWPVVAQDALKRYGAVPVTIGSFPDGYFFSNGPIDKLEKMKGTKYRAHSPMLVQVIGAAGGTSVSMPFGELYGALQRGMVDAYTSALTAVHAAKLQEVTKYAENWPAGMGAWGYFLAETALADLPAELRQKVERAMVQLNKDVQAATLAEVATATEALKASGMTLVEIDEAQRQKVIELAREQIWNGWVDDTGQPGRKLLEQIEAAQ